MGLTDKFNKGQRGKLSPKTKKKKGQRGKLSPKTKIKGTKRKAFSKKKKKKKGQRGKKKKDRRLKIYSTICREPVRIISQLKTTNYGCHVSCR